MMKELEELAKLVIILNGVLFFSIGYIMHSLIALRKELSEGKKKLYWEQSVMAITFIVGLYCLYLVSTID